MKKAILILSLWAPLALGQGLKKEDLGARPPGPGEMKGLQNLTPEQMKQLQALMPSNNNSSSMGGQASPEDLERLMQELKKLNKVVEERNEALEKLMDETP